jgi:hypothetical protein
LPSI